MLYQLLAVQAVSSPGKTGPQPGKQPERPFCFMNQSLFINLLDRPIAYHRIFAKMAGSVNAGVMLSQAFYWSSRTKDPNGWFYKTQAEWEEETCLSRREQESARRNLKDLGCWEEKLIGIPAQLYYRLNLSALESKLTYTAKINSLSMSESAILECTKAPNLECGFSQTTICTESTSENTPLQIINAEEVLRLYSPMPIPKRRGRPPLPADPRFQPFIRAYSDGYIKTFGEKYYFQPKDAKQLQGFLRICDKDIQELIHIVSWCWERSKEKFCPAFVRASTIFDFCQNWPKIIVEAQKQ